MARRVRTKFRKIKKERPDIYKWLADSSDLTSNVAYNRLNKRNISPMTPLSEIRKMAKTASKRSGVPIKITRNMAGVPKADGVCVGKGKKVEARLHPILKYYDKRYIKDVIEHELDHAKVVKRYK